MERVAVLFGTESGNAGDVAEELALALEDAGFEAATLDMEEAGAGIFAEELAVVICTSTFGEGELPFGAEELYEAVSGERPELGALRFAVCALGDSAYPDFCEAGRTWSQLLRGLGAVEVVERYEIDEGPSEEDLAGAREWVERAAVELFAAVR